jgi:hypothetical protein
VQLPQLLAGPADLAGVGYRTTSDYAVVCDLGVQHFDSTRVGVAVARAAYGEIRRLGSTDERVRSTRWRRSSRQTVQLTITVRASDAHRAFEVAGGLLRTGIHAVGGSTAGWEQLHPQLQVLSAAPQRRRSGRRSGRRGRAAELAALPSPPTWGEWSATARRRLERGPVLPPISSASGPPLQRVIDLR